MKKCYKLKCYEKMLTHPRESITAGGVVFSRISYSPGLQLLSVITVCLYCNSRVCERGELTLQIKL